MAAWLLWLRAHPGPLWRRYLSLLPPPGAATCLLNFRGAGDAAELQLPELQAEAEVQARWCAACARVGRPAGGHSPSHGRYTRRGLGTK